MFILTPVFTVFGHMLFGHIKCLALYLFIFILYERQNERELFHLHIGSVNALHNQGWAKSLELEPDASYRWQGCKYLMSHLQLLTVHFSRESGTGPGNPTWDVGVEIGTESHCTNCPFLMLSQDVPGHIGKKWMICEIYFDLILLELHIFKNAIYIKTFLFCKWTFSRW